MPKPTNHAAKTAVLRDYIGGMNANAAARKHGVPTSTAHLWIKGEGARRGDSREESPVTLTAGRWVADGYIQRWVSA